MIFRHFVMDSDELLILHRFNQRKMCLVRLLRFKCRESDAAATDHGITGGVDDIAADGADVKFGAQHIAGNVSVDNLFTA